jgi:hypothetical protein
MLFIHGKANRDKTPKLKALNKEGFLIQAGKQSKKELRVSFP